MDFLEETSVLLERISLIAKLSTRVECDKEERELVAIWISELATAAHEDLLKVIFDVNAPGKIH
ncbi:hypothetical protein ASE99_23750 [Serratia sp. Leaf51]|nr:hypothetical protein ASE99_23750 [Serratia sp. Leaf51]